MMSAVASPISEQATTDLAAAQARERAPLDGENVYGRVILALKRIGRLGDSDGEWLSDRYDRFRSFVNRVSSTVPQYQTMACEAQLDWQVKIIDAVIRFYKLGGAPSEDPFEIGGVNTYNWSLMPPQSISVREGESTDSNIIVSVRGQEYPILFCSDAFSHMREGCVGGGAFIREIILGILTELSRDTAGDFTKRVARYLSSEGGYLAFNSLIRQAMGNFPNYSLFSPTERRKIIIDAIATLLLRYNIGKMSEEQFTFFNFEDCTVKWTGKRTISNEIKTVGGRPVAHIVMPIHITVGFDLPICSLAPRRPIPLSTDLSHSEGYGPDMRDWSAIALPHDAILPTLLRAAAGDRGALGYEVCATARIDMQAFLRGEKNFIGQITCQIIFQLLRNGAPIAIRMQKYLDDGENYNKFLGIISQIMGICPFYEALPDETKDDLLINTIATLLLRYDINKMDSSVWEAFQTSTAKWWGAFRDGTDDLTGEGEVVIGSVLSPLAIPRPVKKIKREDCTYKKAGSPSIGLMLCQVRYT